VRSDRKTVTRLSRWRFFSAKVGFIDALDPNDRLHRFKRQAGVSPGDYRQNITTARSTIAVGVAVIWSPPD